MKEEEKFEGPLPGQIRYDELPPVERKVEVKKEVIEGQMSLIDETKSQDKTNKGSSKPSSNNEKIKKEVVSAPDTSTTDIGNGIITKSLEAVLHDSMIPYTEHVVLDRALPRVEDGLKPVQRRILYTMLELGVTPDKPYRKSARIVGDCMGKYHPHGDSSVYDAMVRMAQNFSLREPLVDGHGNFGSIDGDSAAAMRYTEARLAPLAMELLRDLEKDTVRWSLNFDDTLKEPDMLPGRFPNLLVNGTSGIAVGVATNIPPHDLTEVINGVVAYIDNPKIKLDEMLQIIKGPDFPTGGVIIAGEELVNAYRTGKGKIQLRAKTNIETSGDKKYIVITEIPYQVNKAAMLQRIAELKDEGKGALVNIVEIRDETDRNGLRAVIRVKKEANVNAVLNELYKSTNMQVTFGINMVAIADGKPKQLSLMDIISYYVEYQREVVFRRTKYDLEVAKDRAHIIEGLLIAIKNIDEVIKIIKTSASVSEAKTRLKERFDLSDKQAQAILDMRLARLVNLEVVKLEQELKELQELIEKLTRIYESKRLQLGVVKSELQEIKKRFKSNRKSEIQGKIEEVEIPEEAYIPEDHEVILATTVDGNVKRIPEKNYVLAQKDIQNNTPVYSIHNEIVTTMNTSKVLLFTNLGNVVKVTAENIPNAKWKEKGINIKNVDKKALAEEKVIKIIVLPKEFKEEKVVMFTKYGMVKLSELSEYDINKTYFQGIKLKEKDEVISVELYEETGSLIFVTEQAMVLHFDKNDIPVMGRVSNGVKGINLDNDDRAIYATQILKNGALTIVTNSGYAKRTPLGEFEKSVRYRKGLRAIPLGTKSKKLVYAEYSDDNIPVVVSGLEKMEKKEKIVYDDRKSSGKQITQDNIIAVYPFRT